MLCRAFGLVIAATLAGALAGEAAAQRVTIVTNQQGSLAYSAGAALAKVMNEKLDAQARIQPTGGSSTYFPLLDRGEAQYGYSSAIEVLFAQTGTELYQGQQHRNVLVVAELFDLLQGMIVRANAPAKTIADLKGMSIGGNFTSQKIVIYTQNALLANGGVKPTDLREVPVTNANGAIMGVGQGQIDTSFAPPGTGVVQNAHAAASAAGGIRYLPIDTSPAALARMRQIYPASHPVMIKPAPNYPGVQAEIPVMGYPFLLIGSRAVPEEQVYRLVKMMHDNKGDLAKAFPAYGRFDPKGMARMEQGEFHPGAVKFYKEAGVWPRN